MCHLNVEASQKHLHSSVAPAHAAMNRLSCWHAGQPLAHEYKSENVELVRAGCCNLERHIQNCAKFGVSVVVALNKFVSDTDAELDVVREAALAAGALSIPLALLL